MGSRSAYQTITRILVAFRDERTWSQADLARKCGIGVKPLRAHLRALEGLLPLHADPEPPHVMWSVPEGFYPGGALLGDEEVALVARLLARGQTSEQREKVLRKLVKLSRQALVRNARALAVKEHVLETLERGAAEKVVCRIRYASAHRDIEDRSVSVHVVDHGEHVRFVAVDGGMLVWLRADGVEAATLDQGAHFEDVERAALERFLEESVDGFHGGGEAVPYELFVRMPEARWVRRNLPVPLRVEAAPNGIFVRGRTTALNVLAARVVGLGDTAKVFSEELRAEVLKLARGAVRANDRVLRKGDVRAVGSKRRTG